MSCAWNYLLKVKLGVMTQEEESVWPMPFQGRAPNSPTTPDEISLAITVSLAMATSERDVFVMLSSLA